MPPPYSLSTTRRSPPLLLPPNGCPKTARWLAAWVAANGWLGRSRWMDICPPRPARGWLDGCRQRLTEKGSTRPGRGVAVREPRANAAADLLSQGPAAAAAAGGGGASSVARPLSSSSSCVVVRRVSSVVCRRLSLSVVVGCAVVSCRLSPVVSSSSKTMTLMVRH